MKKQIVACAVSFLLIGAVSADTFFTGAVDSDFVNTNNWDTGLPGDTQTTGIINGGKTSDLGSAHSGGKIIVGQGGTAGTLNINSGGTYGGADAWVGQDAGSTGTVNIASGGTLTVSGTGADTFVGDSAGGYGSIIVNSGGTLNSVKALEIINGTVIYEAGALDTPLLKDEFVVDNNGTLVFKTDGTTVAKIAGSSVAVELGSTSTLDMQLGGSFALGDTWTILTDASGFSGVVGGDGTGVFGTVYDSTDAANVFSVDYGVTVAGSVIVTLTASSAPLPNEFTGLGDGSSWTDSANWVINSPSSTLEAIVNSNLTANLSGADGHAKFLKVGTIDSQSGTVVNGSLTVDGYTQIGTEANATGTVTLSAYAAVSIQTSSW